MITSRAAAWELGSDFDLGSTDALLSDRAQSLPWSKPDEPVTYVESGRQALTLLSRHLRDRGYDNLLMPSHFCDSMVAPFLADDWTVEFTAVDEAWRCLPPASAPSNPERTLILSMSFFGIDESSDWMDFLSSSARGGAAIASDESHRVLGPGLEIAGFRVASLRKTLPVPDGAFLTGVCADITSEGRQADLRLTAMRRKSEYLRGLWSAEHLPLYRQAEALTETALTPSHMSATSRELIKRFDYAHVRASWIANHSVLSEGVAGSGFSVTTEGAPVPSHCVIAGEGVQHLRSWLIQNHIFCPVHWPPSRYRTTATGPWRTDILSIPIDHRYDVNDMERVIDAIRRFTLGKE